MKPWTIVACAGLAISLSTEQAAVAGDLNPPPGAISSTMKPLDAVEPRTCVNDLPGDEGATHRITQPGIYVFTKDVVGENAKDGLRVECDAFPPGDHTVAIMMQGFSLTGVQGAANAILVHNSDPSTRRVHITISGSLRDAPGNPASLITGWSADGVHVENATSVSVEGIHVSNCLGDGLDTRGPAATDSRVKCFTSHFSVCGGDGIHIEDATSVSVEDVRVTGCLGDGLEATSSNPKSMRAKCFTSTFSNNGGDGVIVTLPAADANALEIQEVECLNNTAHGARIVYTAGATGLGAKSRIRVQSMDASDNSLDGLRISGIGDESISCDFDDLRTHRNGGSGTRMSVDRNASADMSVDFVHCSSSGNALDGFLFVVTNAGSGSHHSISWDACSASENGGDGFRCDASSSPAGTTHSFAWTSCASSGNAGNGFTAASVISLPSRGTLYQCRATDNGGHGTRLESLDASIDLCVLSNNTDSGLSAANANVRCHDGSCRANGAAGIDISDTTGSRRASIDAMRCADNDADGISADGLSSLHVSSVSCSSNGRGPGGGGGLLCGNTDHFICDDSSFEDNASHGISISVAGDVTVSGTLVLRNGTGPTGGSGLACDNTITCQCNHLIANDNTGDGASFAVCANVRVQSCDFSENDLDGLRGSGGETIQVAGSTFRANTGNGFNSDGYDDLMFTDNCSASSNAGHGVRVADFNRDGRLDLVTSSGNGGAGILVENTLGLPCGRVTITQCVANANGASGIDLNCTTGGTIRRCESSGNTVAGFVVSGTNHVVIENVASSNPAGGYIVAVPGNSVGTITDEGKMPTNTDPAANFLR